MLADMRRATGNSVMFRNASGAELDARIGLTMVPEQFELHLQLPAKTRCMGSRSSADLKSGPYQTFVTAVGNADDAGTNAGGRQDRILSQLL
jgi:hypothetical protein